MSQNQAKSASDILSKAGTVSMEYLNIFKTKFASTVVDTVYMAESITKNVLPGNPVTREYEVTSHVSSGGPGLLWKLYAGFKKSTKQEATLFVLHKKDLEKYPKKDRESIVSAFKKGATQLARIKHPRILSLQHQLEESKDSLAFATEPCFCSLANVFGNHDNMPFPATKEFSEFKLLEVEIKYGLMQIAEGLHFLHKDVKLLHRNICPESIIINKNGAWKIAGFELFVTNNNDPNDALSFPFKEWDGSSAIVLNQPLEYLAPEYGLSSKCDCSSDMYSYGMLFYTCYNNGKTLYTCDSNYSRFMSSVEDLRRILNSNNKFDLVPSDVREYIKMLMHVNYELRPDAGQVMKIPFFDDVAVKTLEYLDSSFQQDNLQKSMFYKSLPQIIDKLPQRVCLQRIIPCLEQEFINPDMIPFLLPNIFLIAEQSTAEEFVQYILPGLKSVFKLQKPVQILLIVLRNMAMVLSKTPSTDIKEHILPMVCRALESDTVEIQELCLETLPSFTDLLDNQTIKHQIIPRIRKLCWESKTLSVRVKSLVCIGQTLECLEKWVVLDDILPILEKINCRDSAVLMAILGIYKVVLNHPKLGITKDILATRVLPFLIPITVDGNLNMSQFTAYMALVKEMLTQIETEQKKKLEQIEIMEREKSIIPYTFANSSASTKPKEVYKAPETMMDKLMVGYGVTGNLNDPPKSFQPSTVVIPENLATQPKPKKELTLLEKQKLASEFENNTGNYSPKEITNSSSMQSFNHGRSSKLNDKKTTNNVDLLTDNLMTSNLSNLSLSGSNHKPQNNSGNLAIMGSPNNMTSNQNSQMNFQQNKNFPNSNSINQFNSNGFFNQYSKPQTNNSFPNMNNSSSGNAGFFGNLALAPPAANTGLANLNPPPVKTNQFNNLNNLMTPTTKQNGQGTKKSALDDLNDLFG